MCISLFVSCVCVCVFMFTLHTWLDLAVYVYMLYWRNSPLVGVFRVLMFPSPMTQKRKNQILSRRYALQDMLGSFLRFGHDQENVCTLLPITMWDIPSPRLYTGLAYMVICYLQFRYLKWPLNWYNMLLESQMRGTCHWILVLTTQRLCKVVAMPFNKRRLLVVSPARCDSHGTYMRFSQESANVFLWSFLVNNPYIIQWRSR